ncbi:MAG: hypothetical protein P8180_13430 [Gammaproteobacteria bacterium]
MVEVALLSFIVAMTGGGVLAVRGVRRQRVSLPMALAHGALALTALGLLAARVFNGPRVILFNDALLVFALAAVGGLLLFIFRLDKEAPPVVVVVLHALVASAGLILLVAGVVRH